MKQKRIIYYVGAVLLLVLGLVSMFFGHPDGVLCAMAAAVPVGAAGSDTDPNADTPLEQATKDDPDMGITQEGHAATGSAVEAAELDDAQIEDYIMKFEAWKYPLHTDFLNLAKKGYVKTKKPKHPVLGEAILEAVTKADSGYDSTDVSATKNHTEKLNLYGNDTKLFQEKTTIRVIGQTGYDEAGNATSAPLMLYVVSNPRGTEVTVMAVNGPLDSGETYVPLIPAGTKLRVMASALSESELRVPSDNVLPGWRQAYLQKKACAITRTDFYDKMKKLVKFGGQMVKDATLSTFRRKTTSTMLFSAPGVITKFSEVTGTEENCYFQEGILTQLQSSYQINGLPTIADLIAISRMMFTKYAKTNIAQVYCGSIFMEWLDNMDFSKHPEIQFVSKRDKLGVKVGSFESNFGTLEFKLDFSLDENGLGACAITFPMSEAIRYIYEEKTVEHDHKNDTEARDAKSEYYIVDDCLMLTGMNSLFIGQDVSVAGLRNNDYAVKFISVASLAGISSPSTAVVYYLTEPENGKAVGPYKYDGTSAFVPWQGTVNA